MFYRRSFRLDFIANISIELEQTPLIWLCRSRSDNFK